MAEFNLNRFRYNWQGEWQTGTPYDRDDVVSRNGQSYVCLIGHTASTNFSDDLNAVLPGSQPPQPAPRWILMNGAVSFQGVWETAKEYIRGNLAYYDGTVWQCVTSHVSSVFSQDRANWTVFAQHIEYTGNWQSSEDYGEGAIVRYNGNVYKCVQSHTAGSLLEDDQSKWQLFYGGIEYRHTWQPSTEYRKDDLVKYGASIFRVLETHTSSAEFDPILFAVEFPGFQFEGEWDSTTIYQQGDIVIYGGALYYSLRLNQDSDPFRTAGDSSRDWIEFNSSLNFRGEYNLGTEYKTGDVVQRGGQLFEAVQDIDRNDGAGSVLDYLDSDWWELLIPGSAWADGWRAEQFYSVGDVVYYLGSAYRANIEHFSDLENFPGDNGNIYDYWDLVVQAGDTGGLQQKGDLLSYGLSRTGVGDQSTLEDINIPIGEKDQYLSVSQDLEVFWRDRENNSDVVYVANIGVDDAGFDKDRGRVPHKPFKTISYACQYIQDTFNPLDLTKIAVATGDFEEVAPVIVPAGCVVMGDELRSTSVRPNKSMPEYQDDFPRVKQYLNHLTNFILPVLRNEEIVPTEGNNEPQRLNTAVTTLDGVNAILEKVDLYQQYLENELESATNTIARSGSNTANTDEDETSAAAALFQNRRFIAAELLAFLEQEYTEIEFDPIRVQNDVFDLFRGIQRDLEFSGNYATLLAAEKYRNRVLGSNNQNLFLVRDTTGIRQLTFKGLDGELGPVVSGNRYRTVTGGAYVALDPGWGPADERTWIINRSPYIQGVTTLGTGCIGKRIDGTLHNGGNRSMVSNDFTQVLSDGVGIWVSDGGRTELVSVFTYYCSVGYLAERGGIIRATNGNNSYGRFGIVADGNDPTETPQTVSVFNRNNEAQVLDAFSGGDADSIFAFEYTNAGQEYSSASADISGAGDFANAVYTDFRDGGLFEARIVNTTGSGQPGGAGYLVRQGFAQITSNAEDRILLAANDPTNLDTDYEGARIIIIAGDGTGQYGIINTFDTVTKEVTVNRESDGQPGWDHLISGTPIKTELDSTAQYRIEPYVTVSAPPYSSRNSAAPASTNFAKTRFGTTTNSFASVSIATGSGTLEGIPAVSAEFDVVREGTDYTVTLAESGAGYSVGDTFTILGTDLDGASPANDIEISVTAVTEDSTNSITDFTSKGTGRAGRFVSINTTDTAYFSDDGETWQSVALPFTANNWRDLAHGDNRFIALAEAEPKLARTLDGESWEEISLPITENWSSVAFGSGVWVAISDNSNNVVYSTDGGDTWQSTEIPEDTVSDSTGDSTVASYTHVTYGKGIFVAVSSTDLATAVSQDGITWSRIDSAIPEISGNLSYDFVGLQYGDNKFVAIDTEGFTVYSFNGENWFAGEQLSIGSPILVTDLLYSQGLFTASIQEQSTNTSNQLAATDSALLWRLETLSQVAEWSSLAYGFVNNESKLLILADNAATGSGSNIVGIGRQAKVRSDVSSSRFDSVKIWDPGSGYQDSETVTFSVTDSSFTSAVEIDARLGNGVLAQPDFINRGSGYRTSSSEIVITGDGFADIIPEDNTVTLAGISDLPGPGAQIRFDGILDPESEDSEQLLFTITSATDLREDDSGTGTRLVEFTISPDIENEFDLAHNTAATIRLKFSQARVTFHDFLDIGTGNFSQTNYPLLYAGGQFFPASPEQEALEEQGGRIFFVSTDQDGNFKAGDLFQVEQATGVITISAEFFDLGGLSELALGGIRLGGSGTVVREFSTDPTFAQDSDNVVPTQRAIATFLADRLSVGGQDIETNDLQAGRVQIGTAENRIATTTDEYLRVPAPINHFGVDEFGNPSAVGGTMISQQIFLGTDKNDTMQ
jgi:hypothetical protein